MKTYIVHYGELGLKKRNRRDFEEQLVEDIRTALEDLAEIKVRRFYSYITVTAPETTPCDVLEQRLSRIFGIAYLAPAIVAPPNFDAIAGAALSLADGVISTETTFKINTVRGDKQFPIESHEVDRRIGALIVDATQAPVRLKDPDLTMTIQIYGDAAYLFIRRIPGPGGLPIGASGRVLALFSGGIDSPVAAYMLLKRGCTVDFLHFHLLPSVELARNTKVVAMARAVMAPHRIAAPLFLVSAAPFETAMIDIDTRVSTVVFRRFMLRVAERIAQQRGCLALVTGESVGQVASQTLQNINLIGRTAELPILRPLIGLDKAEIVEMAKRIGTYELSIQPYRDPCSIHARRTTTWAHLENVLEVETQISVDALVEETLRHYVDEVWVRF
jgi:thiamine biosynthesis protein ThiI